MTAWARIGQDERVQMVGGHVVAQLTGQQVVVDTGSPVTIGRSGPFWYGGRLVVPRVLSRFDFDRLSALVGTRVDALLGNDVLTRDSWMYTPAWLRVGARAERADGWALPVVWRSGLPVVSVWMGGQKVDAVVDTGAVVSFAGPRLLKGLMRIPIGQRHEFVRGASGWDEFEMPLWLVDGVDLGDGRGEGTTVVGEAPWKVRMMLWWMGVGMILGTSAFPGGLAFDRRGYIRVLPVERKDRAA